MVLEGESGRGEERSAWNKSRTGRPKAQTVFCGTIARLSHKVKKGEEGKYCTYYSIPYFLVSTVLHYRQLKLISVP